MPWWIWLVLALFMLAMIGAGIAYAIVHGLRGLKTAGQVGSRIGKIMDLMQQSTEPHDEPAPSFTESLRDVADRYAQAHVAIIEREHATRARHIRQWARWNNQD